MIGRLSVLGRAVRLSLGRANRPVPVRAMASTGLPGPKKVVIVGGVAGGASCAARLRRLSEEVEITIFEKGP